MKLYFGNGVVTATTIMIIGLVGFIIYSAANRASINYWGRRSLFVLIFGLVVCCFAAARDGLDKSIQQAVDGSCAPGIFPLLSFQNLIGCIGAAIVIISVIATFASKSQSAREIWFYVMSGGVLLKVAVVEISRIFLQ